MHMAFAGSHRQSIDPATLPAAGKASCPDSWNDDKRRMTSGKARGGRTGRAQWYDYIENVNNKSLMFICVDMLTGKSIMEICVWTGLASTYRSSGLTSCSQLKPT